jgi:heme-degrading monooxygenase HmoA
MAILVYLRFCLAETADPQDFEGDLRAMAELAGEQPGYLWSEVGRSMDEPSVYVVLSEWYGIDHVRAWEHDAMHEEIQHKWESQYREAFVHRRFEPWERPPET